MITKLAEAVNGSPRSGNPGRDLVVAAHVRFVSVHLSLVSFLSYHLRDNLFRLRQLV